jgi:hypothetical protein
MVYKNMYIWCVYLPMQSCICLSFLFLLLSSRAKSNYVIRIHIECG